MQKKNRFMIIGVVIMALIGLASGVFVAQQLPTLSKKPIEFHGTLLEKPRDVSEFKLMASNDAVFDNESLKNKWTMVFFGFTNCASICPTTMAELNKMFTILQEKKINPLPQVVLVSLDPARDSAIKLQEYVTAFNPQFLGVRGPNETSVKIIAKEMGVAYTKTTSENKQDYTIDHTGTIMLFNPQGKLTAFFTMPHNAKSLAKDFEWISKSNKLY